MQRKSLDLQPEVANKFRALFATMNPALEQVVKQSEEINKDIELKEVPAEPTKLGKIVEEVKQSDHSTCKKN